MWIPISSLLTLRVLTPQESLICIEALRKKKKKSFNPQNGVSQRGKFKHQLSLIKESFTNKTILLGDFNLNYFKKTLH